MADHLSIKDLPDTSKIDDNKGYLVEGKWLKVIFGIVSQLWRGENIQKGPNIRIRQLGLGGIAISGADQSSDTYVTQAYKPFQILLKQHLVSGVWDNTYDVSLYPGIIAGLVPTNMFDTINQTITSNQYVLLTLVTSGDGLSVASATWSIASSPTPPPAATVNVPPSTFPILIGSLLYDTAPTIIQSVTTNLNALPSLWTYASNPSPGPYDVAYLTYYTWAITTA